MNFLSFTNLVFSSPLAVLGLVVGVLVYRYFLIKNPNALNSLVAKAKTDIEAIEALITQKKSVLPTAVAAPVVATIAQSEPVVITPVVTPVTPVIPTPVVVPAPVAAPAVAPVVQPIPVAAAPVVDPVAQVVAPAVPVAPTVQ